jgi:voltage-gated potassium channel
MKRRVVSASPPGPYEPFMLVLCVWVLVSLAAETFLPLAEETRQILQYADTGICVIFLFDFIRDLVRAERPLEYMKWGWLDLVSSIPMIGWARVGRAARIVRIFRVLRGVRSTRVLTRYVLGRRAESTLLAVVIVSMLFIFFSSIAILQVEDVEGSNIHTAEDALWWAFVTITTVGYGDRYPVTSEGRLIAASLMAAGVGLFGTLTAFVASWFLEPEEKKVENELDDVRAELRAIRALLEQRSTAEQRRA